MNKRGFTLIELLAVTVILGLMVLVVMPNLLSSLADVKEREKTILKERIEEAAMVYAENNKYDFPELKKINGIVYITLGDLVDSGLLNSPIIDPTTDAEMSLTTVIKITRTANNKFAVVVNALLPCPPPVITVSGDNPITLLKGETYTEAGATATSQKDGNLTGSIVKTGSVNTSVGGTYTITYSVTDSYGTTVSEKRTVYVIVPPDPAVFAYTGNSQSYVVTVPGLYKIELWGAQGGNGGSTTVGGKGAYASATAYIDSATILQFFVGGQGQQGTAGVAPAGGWNGGGAGGLGASYNGASGGGATDVRYSGINFANRIIVAAGGGGGNGRNSASYVGNGGYGGATQGGAGTYSTASYNGLGATQAAGGAGGTYATGTLPTASTIGVGGNGGYYSSYGAGGGGGGYYGGGGGAYYYGGGGGGSSYATSCLGNISLVDGNASMPAPAGGTETGHAGNGYAKITFISLEGSGILPGPAPEPTQYAYTGETQTYTVPVTGKYTIEVWGAQGASAAYSVGGNGAYATGAVTLSKSNILNIYVGGQGTLGAAGVASPGGWNGGGNGGAGASYPGGGGGGASDVRLGGTALTDRIIVAAGGGGCNGRNSSSYIGNGGYGGAPNGGAGTYSTASYNGSGATQSAGGAAATSTSGTLLPTAGDLGIGGYGGYYSSYGAGGGGGGYYGGGGGAYYYGGGGGGSSYVSGTFFNTSMIAGNASMTSPTGTTETGHTGNGYVKISFFGY